MFARSLVIATLFMLMFGASSVLGQTRIQLNRPCGADSMPDVLRFFIPQKFRGADFRPSCREHDDCYGYLLGTQYQCDDLFRQSLYQACENSRRPARCRRRADAMYRAVRKYGSIAYGVSD